ncbi:MAG TPA: P63C domain-containing protein [Allosphingosinicella sp.]
MTDEPVGRAKGGVARAENLTPLARSDIARAAAAARWGKLPRASHVGNFKEKFGIDVECYVLGDLEKTAVISQTGMARVLGLSPRGNSFPSFITSRAMAKYVGGDLRQKVENPVRFQWSPPGGGVPPMTIHGFDTALLIDVCNAIIAAASDGSLKAARYKQLVQQAHIIVGASAKSGIRHLVYALAGYNPTTEEVVAAFKLYVQEEAKKYEPEFPSELYMEWHRLYQIPVPERGKPWHFKHLTVRHIYHPLAKSSGNLLRLLKAIQSADGGRKKKLFQFLNEVGARALRIHLGRVLEMAESSPDAATYEHRIKQRFGDQRELELVLPSTGSATPSPLPIAPLPLFERSLPAVPAS